MVSAWLVDTFTLLLHTQTHTYTFLLLFLPLLYFPGYLSSPTFSNFITAPCPPFPFTSNTNVSFKCLFLSVCQSWHHRKLRSEMATLYFLFHLHSSFPHRFFICLTYNSYKHLPSFSTVFDWSYLIIIDIQQNLFSYHPYNKKHVSLEHIYLKLMLKCRFLNEMFKF